MAQPAGAAFLGHGSPMNAIEQNRYTDSWRTWSAARETPRAVLVVSAHWFVQISAVTAMAEPRTIHDFYGFPDELFAVEYPAPGTPDLAKRVTELAPEVGLDRDSWGLDHGAWSVLTHINPDSDVPVVQLSVHASEPAMYHFDLGARLAPLLDDGVAIVASGNVVHNLRRMQPGAGPFEWNRNFDDEVRQVMTTKPADAVDLVRHPDYAMAAPTPDHFYPLLYLAGLSTASGRGMDVLVDGFEFGSISMTSYALSEP